MCVNLYIQHSWRYHGTTLRTFLYTGLYAVNDGINHLAISEMVR